MNSLYLGNHGPFPADIMSGMEAPAGANLASIEELDSFIKHFFTFNMDKGFFIQMAVAGSWIAILMILCSITILYRIYKGQFWIFQLQRRPEGVYVVPNALTSFLVIEGLFAIVWLAFIIVQYYGYWRQELAMQHHLAVFNLIIWWPLWVGAFFCAWGSVYSAPGALDKGALSSTRLGKYIPRPAYLNLGLLGGPVVLILSLVAPIVLSQAKMNSALSQYESLHFDMFRDLASSSNQLVSPANAREYLQRASDVWNSLTIMANYLGIGYTLWAAWAGAFLLFYIPGAGYLVYLVYQQLKAQSKLIGDERRKMAEIEGASPEMELEGYRDEPPENSLLFQPLSSSQERQYIAGLADLPSAPPKRKYIRERKSSEKQQEGGEGHQEMEDAFAKDGDLFFPRLKRNRSKLATLRIGQSKGSSTTNRYRHLRRCFINLGVLYVSIVLAAAIYAGISASLGKSLYNSYLNRSQDCSNLIETICAIAAWGAVVFGTLTFFAIIARFADPANLSSPIAVDHKPGKGGQSDGKKKNKSTTHDRSLPAVPESVLSTTRDDPLQTFASIDWDNFDGKRPPRKPKKGAQVFKIKEKAGRGLILQPDDQSFNGATSIVSAIDTNDGMSPKTPHAEGSKAPARSSKRKSELPQDVIADEGEEKQEILSASPPPLPAKSIVSEIAPEIPPHATPPDTDRLSQISWKSFENDSANGSSDEHKQTIPSKDEHSVDVSRRTSSLLGAAGLPDLITSSPTKLEFDPSTPSSDSSFPRTPIAPMRALLPEDQKSSITIRSFAPLSALMMETSSTPSDKNNSKSQYLGDSLYSEQAPQMTRSNSAPRSSPGIFF